MHGAVEILGPGQILRGTEQHDGVTVMAAPMHLALVRRLVRELVHLDEVERIHVDAQADRPVALAGLQRADHADLGPASVHLHAERLPRLDAEIGRAVLFGGWYSPDRRLGGT